VLDNSGLPADLIDALIAAGRSGIAANASAQALTR
jgi:hypothetical protein